MPSNPQTHPAAATAARMWAELQRGLRVFRQQLIAGDCKDGFILLGKIDVGDKDVPFVEFGSTWIYEPPSELTVDEQAPIEEAVRSVLGLYHNTIGPDTSSIIDNPPNVSSGISTRGWIIAVGTDNGRGCERIQGTAFRLIHSILDEARRGGQ